MHLRRPLELEQMVSADSPLAVRCVYGGRHRQRRRHSYTQVYQLDGPHGGGATRISLFDRFVLVRAAVCRQMAQWTSRLKRSAAVRSFTRFGRQTAYWATWPYNAVFVCVSSAAGWLTSCVVKYGGQAFNMIPIIVFLV